MISPDLPTRKWTTLGQPDAFAFWRESVCQAFTALSPEPALDRRFHGEIEYLELREDASLSVITSEAQLVQRRTIDISRSPSDSLFVNFQLAGNCKVRQRGIQTLVPSNALVLVDARQPFQMQFDGPFRQICVHFPMPLLFRHGFDPGGFLARSLPAKQVHGAALFDNVGDIVGGVDMNPDMSGLVQLLLMGFGGGNADTLADDHLRLIRRFVVQHCTNPDLCPRTIADHFRISVRYVHKLFARSGTTYGRFVLSSRLKKSRAMLYKDNHVPIGEIAALSGFQSQSHFCHAFKRQFRVTPRELRNEIRHGRH